MIKLVMIALGFLWPFLLKAFWWVVAAFGVGFMTYSLVATGLDWMLTGVAAGQANLGAVGGQFVGAIAAFSQRFGVNLLLAGIAAGYTSRISLAGVTTLKRMVFKV